MSSSDIERLSQRTIADFGDQWVRFQGNEGYYGSTLLFADICGPLLTTEDLEGARVAEIGSGTGRIVRMLLDGGAAHVLALEPSAAFDVLRHNLADRAAQTECIQATGECLPQKNFDLVVSIGVLHHIPDPAPVLRAAYGALRPGGRLLLWLYGREGNGTYLALTEPVRRVTTRLDHGPLLALATALNLMLTPYIWMCRFLHLPLRRYFTNVFGRMPRDKRKLIIYDQLRPAYARYYTRDEAIALVASAGFGDIRTHHRHEYSWTVLATRP